MDVFKHLINDTEIIGIGPLYIEHSKDQAMRSLYNSQRYVFTVHTRHGGIEIYSDFFEPGPADMKNEQERKRMLDWSAEYCIVRAKIAEQIGGIICEGVG